MKVGTRGKADCGTMGGGGWESDRTSEKDGGSLKEVVTYEWTLKLVSMSSRAFTSAVTSLKSGSDVLGWRLPIWSCRFEKVLWAC